MGCAAKPMLRQQYNSVGRRLSPTYGAGKSAICEAFDGKRPSAGGDLFLRWNPGRPALGEVANPVIQLELFSELRVGDFDLDAAVSAVLTLV